MNDLQLHTCPMYMAYDTWPQYHGYFGWTNCPVPPIQIGNIVTSELTLRPYRTSFNSNHDNYVKTLPLSFDTCSKVHLPSKHYQQCDRSMNSIGSFGIK